LNSTLPIKELALAFLMIMSVVTLFASLGVIAGLMIEGAARWRKVLCGIGEYYLLAILSTVGFLSVLYLIECARRW